ncbi:DUF6233 domain-containing protein [Streptomyces atratus]|uniref:DUF6233 domain-containing protein n=1 Tax=Streptomyces atratus TaxID=1893 RepID=UPI003396DFA0
MWVERIGEAVAAVEQREEERQQGEERRPPPDWIIELSIGVGARPIEVQVGGCYAAGKRHRAITRERALAALADGIRACIHCRPDTELGVLCEQLAHSGSPSVSVSAVELPLLHQGSSPPGPCAPVSARSGCRYSNAGILSIYVQRSVRWSVAGSGRRGPTVLPTGASAGGGASGGGDGDGGCGSAGAGGRRRAHAGGCSRQREWVRGVHGRRSRRGL